MKQANNYQNYEAYKKLGTSHDVKSFIIGSFLKCNLLFFKEQMILSVKKALTLTLIRSTQNLPKTLERNGLCFTDCFSVKFAPKCLAKILRNRPIFREFAPENQAKMWLYFPSTYHASEALIGDIISTGWFSHLIMSSWLPYLPGVPHLHVNRPLVTMKKIWLKNVNNASGWQFTPLLNTTMRHFL